MKDILIYGNHPRVRNFVEMLVYIKEILKTLRGFISFSISWLICSGFGFIILGIILDYNKVSFSNLSNIQEWIETIKNINIFLKVGATIYITMMITPLTSIIFFSFLLSLPVQRYILRDKSVDVKGLYKALWFSLVLNRGTLKDYLEKESDSNVKS